MSNGGDRLHLNNVHLFEGVVKNTGCINNLKSKVLVVKVAAEERLGCEGPWLNIHIGTADAAQEAALADIGVSADQKCPGVGVDRWQTAKMLADLVQVGQGIFESLDDSGHTTEAGSFQLLALEETLSVLRYKGLGFCSIAR